MKKWVGLGAALAVIAGLVVVTLTATGQAARAKGPLVLVGPPVTASPTPASPAPASSTPTAPPATTPPGPACVFGTEVHGSVTGAASKVHLSGACTGDIVATFVCSASLDDFYASVRAPLDDSHGVYLTMNVEGYTGPGDYSEGEAFIQVTGPAGARTWSNRTLHYRVGPDNSITITPGVLAADPGTGSIGSTTLSGVVACGK